MKPLLLALTALSVTAGCTTTRPYTLGAEELTDNAVTVIDARDKAELAGALPRATPTYTVPARRFDPPLPDLLEARLGASFGAALSASEIVLTRFRVRHYFGATHRNAHPVRPRAVSALGDDRRATALAFASARRGYAIDVALVEIEGTIDGVPFAGRGAWEYLGKPPSAVYLGMPYDLPAAREATRLAIDRALADVVTSIVSSRPDAVSATTLQPRSALPADP